MAEQKEGPGAGGNQSEAEDQNTNSQGGEPIMIQTTTTPLYDAAAVIEALAMIDAVPDDQYFHFEPGDELYQEVPAVIMKALAWMDGEPVGWDQGTWVHRVLPLDVEGRKVEVIEEAWVDALRAVPRRVKETWRVTANAAIRVGDLLVVSLGLVFPDREVLVDGEPMVELVTFAEMQRRKQAVKVAWLDAHPEIMANKPAWAKRVSVDAIDKEDDDGEVEIWFEREVGPVQLSKYANYRNGTLAWADGSDAPSVSIDRDKCENITLDGMREIAAALMAAIPVVEAAMA